MALLELTQEQVQTMTLEEKDEWWLKNVYKGHMPQLNLRSALTGMILGGILSLTNLYVGIKTGWTLGVGISSVILSFAIFKMLAKFKIGNEMSILENNAMQSIATSAGYMTAPLMASMPAYMMVTGQVIPMWQTFWWIVVLAILGVLFAFPLKRKFINDDQLPFPEGYAAGVVLDNLHHGDAKEGLTKTKFLIAGAAVSALVETLRNHKIMESMKLGFLSLPEYWDDFIYKFAQPSIMGTPLKNLTVQWDTSLVMMGTGGLMGIGTAMSLLLGACINYLVLVPIMIHNGVIPEAAGFKNISMWSLWGGTAMMTTASLYSFFANPTIFIEAYRKFTSRTKREPHALDEIELPGIVSLIGVPVVGAIAVYMGHEWFGIHYILGIIAIPLVFVFTLIAVTSTGLTAITPGSALGKLTQVTYSILAPGNIPTNLMTAGITSEVSLNASNLLMDIKPAYMLGGKPRHQAVGHVLGIFAGALIAVPVFYFLFQNDITQFGSDRMPLPSASVWKAVAEVLTKGLNSLHPTAQVAIVIGAILGIVLEVVRVRTKGRFPISGVGLGLAFILRFTDSLAMALGALIFWYARRRADTGNHPNAQKIVDSQEIVCAGIIAGGAIIGIALIIIETML